MSWLSRLIVCLLAVILPSLANAQDTERRMAIVIGNAAYQAGALNTAANDAGLIAQTLEAAGFDVVGARDLDQDSLRRAFRDFLDKAQASGPNTVAFVYLSGYGLQLEGENYYVPVDARIGRDTDIVAQAIRISDYTRPLAGLGLRTSIVVLDAARPHPFAASGSQLAGGLALIEPEQGTLFAFNAAPDTVAPEGQGPYGPYAQALAEMMREGGVPLAEIFERVRLRVNEITRGAEVPWHASKVEAPFIFFERAPDAPPPPVSYEEKLAYRARPIRDLGAEEAYLAALERDTLEGYLNFLAVYPDDPMARRVRAIVGARREAITWRRTRVIDTPEAYWSYLRRYPRGRHAYEARRRLAFLSAVLEPPPSFTFIDYEVPPPPPEEFVYVERRVLIFNDPVFAFAPPPPPPLIFLAPPRPEFVVLLAPPPPPVALFVLPIPIYRPVPIWVRSPVYVAPPPPNNVIFNNIHNTVVINNTTNVVTITNRSGQTTTMAPPAPSSGAPGSHPAGGPIGPALPPSVAQKASQAPQDQPPGIPSQAPQPGKPIIPQPGPSQPTQLLPGMKGVPLPIIPPAAPAQPGQAITKQPVPPPQSGQPLLKGPTPPAAKGMPPVGTTLPGSAQPKQPVPRPQTGQQPLINGQTPPPGKGTPPAGTTLPGSGVPKQPGSLPQTGQPLPKNQILPATKGAPPITAPPPGQPLSKQPSLPAPAQASPKAPVPPPTKDTAPSAQQLRQQQEQQRQRQLEQQRQQQKQIEQQRQQQLQQQEQQRQRQLEQQRQQQLEQQRQKQIEQQRLLQQQRQQQEQQRQRQIEQQRQQQEQQRQRQLEQQRQQQIQQQRQQQPPPSQPPKKPQECGRPGQPPCPKQ